MKKVLILGSYGMLGHLLNDYLSDGTDDINVYTLARKEGSIKVDYLVDLRDRDKIVGVLKALKPDVIINCAGLLNRTPCSQADLIFINSFLPHFLVENTDPDSTRIIQISTDCVFSGKKGFYSEYDEPDATDPYGKSKAIGELNDRRNLTIRTSIIGPEINTDGVGLLHWFLNSPLKISGYQSVYWNGVTTLELAKAIKKYISFPCAGTTHLVGPHVISKLELLETMNRVFYHKNRKSIQPVSLPISDKSLAPSLNGFSYKTPSYEKMLSALKEWMEYKAHRYNHYNFD